MYQAKEAFVYILTNKYNTVLYTGVTNNLARRLMEHQKKSGDTFTGRYLVTKLVYYEVTERIEDAIAREKQLKGGSRQKKIDLVNSINLEWKDLSGEVFEG